MACGTAFYVLAHKLCEAQPPELSGNKLVGFEITRVSSSLMVMAADKDGTAEGVFQGDIDTALVCEDMVIKLPI